MDLARTYVRDLGGGLIMLGGDQSFGLGGYYKTALEEILPVRSDFEKEKEKPSLAMVLVIDKSGSMGGEKIEMAKEAAKSAIELLGPERQGRRDRLRGRGLLGHARSTPAPTRRSCSTGSRTIEAGGGTAMYPAMEEAYEALSQDRRQAQARHHPDRRHLGPRRLRGDHAADGRRRGSPSRRSASARGTTSSSSKRSPGSATAGATSPRTRSSIPQIFAKETVAASKSAINEQPFTPQVVRPTQALAGLDFDAAPLLLGYVVTRPKPTSELILASESGDPLLTWWRYGLGMSVAFTSDAKPRWAAEWLAWPGFGKFWAQVVRHAMRKAESKGVVVQVDQKDRQAVGHARRRSTRPAGSSTTPTTGLTVIDPQLGKRSWR